MRLLRPIAILAFALLSAQATSLEVPFDFREGFLWVEVTVPQSAQPLNFLLDTGAGASVINRSTADRLRLKLGSQVSVRGVETTLTAHRVKVFSATIGTISLPAEYLAVDLTTLSRSCQREIDGLLGADFFCEHAIQLDFKERKLRIFTATPPRSTPPRSGSTPSPQGEKVGVRWPFPDPPPRSIETLPLQPRPCGMRVPITVNGHKRQWVRLDTGCASALQWVSSRVQSKDCNPKVAIGLAEVSIPQTDTTVEIGRQIFPNIPTGLHEQPIFAGEAGLLGNGLLSRFSRITIDAKARRLILEP